MNTIRLLFAAAALMCASPLIAKDYALTSAWNGIWSDVTGQHRCAIQIVDGDASRLTLVCQLGPDGVYADLSPMPPPGWQIFVQATLADYGKPGSGHIQWGQISWHGLCDESGLPYITANIYSPPTAVDVTFRAVTVADPASICVETGGKR